MGEINQELCRLIKEAQGNRGQNQFAQQCGISSSAITRIFTGTYVPSAKTLSKIASHAYNGVTYEILMNAAGYLTNEQQENPSLQKGKWINVYGNIAAGIPIEAIEDIIDQEEITAEMAETGEFIALKVKGSSM